MLVDEAGGIVAQASRPHRMLVPQPGWAEHDPEQDWWGDFCFISKKLIAESGIDPKSIRSVGTSAIGPCMLPVDAEGNPLMNGVLYGVDTRSVDEIEALNARIGEDRVLDVCGNALTSQSVGPKILWLKNNRPDIYAKAAKIVTSTTFIVQRLTGQLRHRPLYGGEFLAALRCRQARLYQRSRARDHRSRQAAGRCCGARILPGR